VCLLGVAINIGSVMLHVRKHRWFRAFKSVREVSGHVNKFNRTCLKDRESLKSLARGFRHLLNLLSGSR
jgi:hypothetical protein